MYDQLYAAWKREIDDPSLGGLAPDFYIKIIEYLTHIKEDKGAIDKKSIKVALLDHEAHNVERMLQELLDIRYRKILKTITRLHKAPIELLTTEETKMVQNFVAFENNYEQFKKNLLEGQQAPITVTLLESAISPATLLQSEPQSPKPEIKTQAHVTHKRLTLRFIKNIPAIMGADMKSYGPFVAEDVASLPELNAKILVKQGLAVLIEVS
jgi:DNA replication initiation complex subunit (GINS family)